LSSGVIVEGERAAEVGDRPAVALPEGEHDEVLGVREAQRLEDRPVQPDQRPRRQHGREADLALERQRIRARRVLACHACSSPPSIYRVH
jgi:hypothetical protein